MKYITANINNEKVRLEGNGTYGIKDKLKKYGFIWKDGAWEAPKEKLEIVKKYIKNFKNDKLELNQK